MGCFEVPPKHANHILKWRLTGHSRYHCSCIAEHRASYGQAWDVLLNLWLCRSGTSLPTTTCDVVSPALKAHGRNTLGVSELCLLRVLHGWSTLLQIMLELNILMLGPITPTLWLRRLHCFAAVAGNRALVMSSSACMSMADTCHVAIRRR